MAEWSKEKVDPSQINGGQEYTLNSDVSLEQLNAMVNSGLYSQEFVEHLADTPDISEAANVGTPTITLVDNIVGGKTYKKFKFVNIKGEQGIQGRTPVLEFAVAAPVYGTENIEVELSTNEVKDFYENVVGYQNLFTFYFPDMSVYATKTYVDGLILDTINGSY